MCSQRGKCDAKQVVAADIEEPVARLLRLIVVPDEAYQSAIERVEIDNGEVVRIVGKEKHRDLIAVLGTVIHAGI